MKKFVFAAAAALVMCVFITSCTTESGKCYHVMYTIPEQPAQTDSTGEVVREKVEATFIDTYKWLTASEKSACEANWEDMEYQNVKVVEATEYKTKAACLSEK